jgi:hypothetical protein
MKAAEPSPLIQIQQMSEHTVSGHREGSMWMLDVSDNSWKTRTGASASPSS